MRAVRRSRGGTVGITTAVQGAGGFGKTTVAKLVRADRRVLRRFRGRVYWVTVGRDAGKETLPGLVNDLIAQLDPERAITFTNAQQASEHLAAVLAKGPRRLLILDDVWTGQQLAAFPAAGRCARLVTTRIPSLTAGTAVPVRVDQMTDRPGAGAAAKRAAAAATGGDRGAGGGDRAVAAAAAAGRQVPRRPGDADPRIASAADDLLGRLRAGGALQVDELTGAAGRRLDVGGPRPAEQCGPGDDRGQHQPAQPRRACPARRAGGLRRGRDHTRSS